MYVPICSLALIRTVFLPLFATNLKCAVNCNGSLADI